MAEQLEQLSWAEFSDGCDGEELSYQGLPCDSLWEASSSDRGFVNDWPPCSSERASHRFVKQRFMERLERSLSTEVVAMPATAVAKIASYLPWRCKLSLVEGVPEWGEYVRDTEAWRRVWFEDMPSQSMSEVRALFLHCLALYGRYMLDLHILFKQEVDGFVRQIFDKLQRYASHLAVLRLSSVSLCVDSLVEAFITTLQSCSRLRAVHLHWPQTYLHSHNNVVQALYTHGLSDLLHTLDLSDTACEGDLSHLTILKHFRRLHKLRVKREHLGGSELVSLAQASLHTLSLYQDEESTALHKDSSLLYDDSHWQRVLQAKPTFTVNLIVRNMYLLRSMFPAQAPIHSLVFVDIYSTITKGLLEHIVHCYGHTLQIFVYSWTCDIDLLVGSNLRLDDRRVPASLPRLVSECPRLHTLVYGYEIASTYVLQIATIRTLQLVISLEALCFHTMVEDRETQTDIRTDRQTDIWTDRRGDTQTDIRTDRPSDIGTDRQSDTQTDRQSDTQTDRQSDTQLDTQSHTQSDCHTHTDPRTNMPLACLVDNCKDVESLELAVSTLFGKKWRAADPMSMAFAVKHYSSL